MASKKPVKKTMGKKALKKTRGGAVDAFIYFKPTGNIKPAQNLASPGDVNGVNFLKQ